MKEETLQSVPSVKEQSKVKDYMQLMKLNLSMLVIFSSVISYLLAPHHEASVFNILALSIGGSLTTTSANIINQILERHSDKFMRRTMNRPLPTGRIGVTEAWIIVVVTGVLGVFIISSVFNLLAGMLGLLSLLLYGFLYTPMKKIHPIATFIGAIPGSLPLLIGWVASEGVLTGPFSLGGWALFLIQFFWQFPHFWAIAWMGYEDYLKAGIQMLPSYAGRTKFTGVQCMLYSATLIPICMLPNMLGISGVVGMWICVILSVLFFLVSFNFYRKNDMKSAKQLMFASITYLPIVYIVLFIDKI